MLKGNSVMTKVVEFQTSDAWRLEMEVFSPPGGRDVRAALLMGPAMMVNRRCLDRPRGAGFATYLASRGYLCYTIDFRGHGASEPRAAEGGSWSYDDIALIDIPEAIGWIKARHPDLPLGLVGNSLTGHAGLGMLGRMPEVPIDFVVSLAANVRLPPLEPSRRRWAKKVFQFHAMGLLTRIFGYFPSRLVRMGPEDEARPYVDQLVDCVKNKRWTTADGSYDYLEGLGRVRVPVLAIAGRGDRLMCHPVCSELFHGRLEKADLDHRVYGKGDLGLTYSPGHVELVADPRSAPIWEAIADWMDGQV